MDFCGFTGGTFIKLRKLTGCAEARSVSIAARCALCLSTSYIGRLNLMAVFHGGREFSFYSFQIFLLAYLRLVMRVIGGKYGEEQQSGLKFTLQGPISR